MGRPVTLFTGQWADLNFETICSKAKSFGYDGVELACWGDHFDVEQAVSNPKYCKQRWEILADHKLTAFAISNHLIGQAVCDNIDERHKAILPADVWGDGDPEGVRKRAAKRLITTAQAARAFLDAKPASLGGKKGATGVAEYWQRGFDDFAKRFGPILDAFDKLNINFALEVHPTEIAFDIASAEQALKAVKNHKRFGFNYDPSHLAYQGVDYVKFIRRFADRIFHVHMK
ncbi:MAG: sugar phosphate isomerase/epimerase, partial [Verrucomicrobiae bacterium]|nr:sugar phosphate isomerase/epimerase [Verrucomicrobiae bacterium]